MFDDDEDEVESGGKTPEQLYSNFRKQLSIGYRQSQLSSMFDEDDLVDIFDYAGDMGDFYVREQVMQLAARYYSSNDDLLKRRAIWLLNIDENAFGAFIDDNLPEAPDALWIILLNRRNPRRGKEACEALADIVANYRFDDDETIIQFVALARAWQQEKWLIDNLAKVKKICCSFITLYFEIGRLAETTEEIAASIKLLDELTMKEPFNLDFWALLAELHTNAGNYDNAMDAIDYGLSIDSNDADLLSLKGFVELRRNQPDKARETLRHAIASSPDDFDINRNLAEAEQAMGNTEQALKLCRNLFYRYPTDRSLLLKILMLNPANASDLLTEHFAATGPDEEGVVALATELCQNGFSDRALEVMKWYKATYSLSQPGVFAMLDMLYINEHYQEAHDFMIDNLQPQSLRPEDIPIVAIIASILIRVRIYDEAIIFCNDWIQRLKESSASRSNPYRLMHRGVYEILRDIFTELSKPRFDYKRLDELTL